MKLKQKDRNMLVVSVSLRTDQIQHINGRMQEARDRSRWIRLAIDQRIAREKKGQDGNKSSQVSE